MSAYLGLAYCRHLSTVRTHLSALVNPAIIEPDNPHDAKGGLSAEVWKTFLQDSSVSRITQTFDFSFNFYFLKEIHYNAVHATHMHTKAPITSYLLLPGRLMKKQKFSGLCTMVV